MENDVTATIDNLPLLINIKVHSFMCTELMKLVESALNIVREIEAARPRCQSGIKSLCLLISEIAKAESLIRECSESSKLYLALTGNKILGRCRKSKVLLEQSLIQFQNMVPMTLASKISVIITKLRRVKFSLDPCEEEAGKAVRSLLEGYKTGDSSENGCIRMVASRLRITSERALLIERRSLKKLLFQVREGDGKQLIKKRNLMILLDLLKRHGNLITSGPIENDSILQHQDYRSGRVDYSVDREEAIFERGGNVPPEQFKCPLSYRIMYDPVVIDSGETFERMWIQEWFDGGNDTCPKTKRKLSNFSLTPNTAMKHMISKWCGDNEFTISDPSIDLSTDCSTWENSSVLTSLSSINFTNSPLSNTCELDVEFSRELEGTLPWEFQSELDVEFSQQLDDTLPWEFQCKFVEDLMIRSKDIDKACKLMSCGILIESIVRFLKIASDIYDVEAQRIGCLLLLFLVKRCSNINCLSKDAYRLISEFLESEVIEEALDILEKLSSHQNHRPEIESSGALTHIFKILDTQSIQIQTPALKILYNLTSTRNLGSFSSYLIPKLVTLYEEESLSRYCIAILANLCGNQDNKSIIAKTNGFISIVAKALESESCEEQEQALKILLSLCSQSIQYCRLVMDEAMIPSVVYVYINGNGKGKAKALKMLELVRDMDFEECAQELPSINKEFEERAEEPSAVNMEFEERAEEPPAVNKVLFGCFF